MVNASFFGPSATFHHVGLAISNTQQSLIGNLNMVEDSIQRVKVGFMNIGDCHVEVIQPTTEDSPVQNSIKKGNKLVHLCFEVDDIDEGLLHAISHKFKVIQNPTPAVAFGGRKIAWVFHPVWGLFELLERKPSIEDHSV
ncbi:MULTISPECIES: VOC family protein [Brevibacillus]|uniref:VOC family protein n=1 Tax=Brevibacillus TaxID=55080 RepID=UPI000B3ABCAE|nr:MULTISPECIES: VOC family protein [Brevibacillus]NRS49383.1 VOC family protein [Brevibacillus sp. HB2.2]OUQ90228.1 hypothetical protein B5G50_00690 [Brevibacillus brevis]